jgi:DNA-binding transcriptional LysR family regulator
VKRIISLAMSDKAVQRLHLTLRQLEAFAATADAGSTRGAADRVARSQSAASNALAELEGALGVQLFDRVGRRLSLNENGRALLPRAAAVLQQAAEIEALFGRAHAAALRLAASFTIGEYLLPGVVSAWKRTHPDSQGRLDIANTQEATRSSCVMPTIGLPASSSATTPSASSARWPSGWGSSG